MATEPTIQQAVLAEVAEERQRQDEQWGESNHGPEGWALIIAKHAGRTAADALDYLDVAGADSDEYYAFMQFRDRCIKLAAICVAAAECIDRAEWMDGRASFKIANGPATIPPPFDDTLPDQPF